MKKATSCGKRYHQPALACASTMPTSERADQGEALRHLVGDHLRRRAQAAHEREFVVRRPAADDEAVDADRRESEDDEHPGVDVGDVPGELAPGGPRAHGDDGEDDQGRRHDQAGGKDERPLDRLDGERVLLDEELHDVGDRLQEAPRAHPVGADPGLDEAEDLALGQHQVGDHRQDA
jgi:hypothetical protein